MQTVGYVYVDGRVQVKLPVAFTTKIIAITCTGYGDESGDSNAAYWNASPVDLGTIEIYARHLPQNYSCIVTGY
ncbi:hypothetical protein D3C75_800720 [compost metagenome]